MKLVLPVIVLVALQLNVGFSAETFRLSAGANEVSFPFAERNRRLLVTTPDNFDPGRTYPTLFCFHGAGGRADGQSSRWGRHANQGDLVVVSAEAVQPLAKWNFKDNFHTEEHDDVAFVLSVVNKLIEEGVADKAKLYATGHSSGGLFCYRLAKETDVFAAFSPMSCGMVKGSHDPGPNAKRVPIMQVIGDQDKSFHGSTNPRVTMYSARERIEIWRRFNQCDQKPMLRNHGEGISVQSYTGPSGNEVAFCKVEGQGHHLRLDLRDRTDALALKFLLKHRRD